MGVFWRGAMSAIRHFRARLSLHAAFGVLLLAMLPSRAEADLSFTDIGDLGNGYTEYWGSSQNGFYVVGNSEFDVNGAPKDSGYIWSPDMGLVAIPESAGYDGSLAEYVSDDGSIVAGTTYDNSSYESFTYYWRPGQAPVVLPTLGGDSVSLGGMSRDGSTIVGSAELANGYVRAFRWTLAGGMENLGAMGGYDTSYARLVSNNGSVVGGILWDSNTYIGEPYRWTSASGMVPLGLPSGGISSDAFGMNSDGSMLAGEGYTASSRYIWYWTQPTGMQTIPGAGDDYGYRGMSASGSVIFGTKANSNTESVPFVWSPGGSIVTMNGYANYAAAPQDITDDGQILVGGVYDSGSSMIAVRWVNGAIESISDMLTSAGVSATDYAELLMIRAISGDGSVMIGEGRLLATTKGHVFIITNGGITTPEEVVQSLQPVVVPAQQTVSAMVSGVDQSMFTARNAFGASFPQGLSAASYAPRGVQLAGLEGAAYNDLMPAAGGQLDRTRYAFYATGAFGAGHNNDFSNKGGSGSTGLLMKATPDLAIGVGLIASQTNEETELGGSSHAGAMGASAMLAYEPENGLRLYGSAALARLNVETSRFYLNAGSPESSHGETSGVGYGVALRAGYELAMGEGFSLMPYGEAQYSHASLDAYTEVGGAFPASMGRQSSDSFITRLGAEVSHDVSESLTLRGRAAMGHRFSDGGSVLATSASLTQTVTSDPGAPNWAELGLTGIYNLNERTTFSADLSTRLGNTPEPAINGMLAVRVGF